MPAASAPSPLRFSSNSPAWARPLPPGAATDAPQTGDHDMSTILNSYVEDRWFTPESGFADIPSAIDGRVVARASTQGPRFRRSASPCARGRRSGAARAHLPRTRRDAEGHCGLSQRAQGRALPDRLRHRCHPPRQLDRHRRRHRHAVRLCLARQEGTAERALRHRGRDRGAVQGRHLRRPPHPDAADRRRRPHQRLQLPLLGHAGEAGADDPRRRAGRSPSRRRRRPTWPKPACG